MMALPASSSLPKRNQQLIVFGIPAAIALLLLFWAYRALGTLGPIDNSIDQNNKLPALLQRNTPDGIWTSIVATQHNIDDQQAEIDKGPTIAKQLASLSSDIKAAKERLPSENEKAEMQFVIRRLASEIPKDIGTVNVKSVTITGGSARTSASEAATTINYQTEIEGDQDGILKYIDSLEKNQRFMSVNNLSIHPAPQAADLSAHRVIPGLHAVHLDIVTYVYNPGAKK